MKKKTVLILTVILTFLLSSTACAYTMYAADGRTIDVDYAQVDAWKSVGWYENPVMEMYAPDSRVITVNKADVLLWKNVGWYEHPVMNMYAPDGRVIIVNKADALLWKNVGWYEYPVGSANSDANAYKAEYQRILKDKLLQSISDEASFSLVNIDADNIPELVFRTNECHAAGAEVFTCKGGKAVSLGSFGEFGDIYIRPGANRFTSQYWGMGCEYISLYEISGSSAALIVELSGYESPSGDETGFTVNGESFDFSGYMSTKESYGLGKSYYEISDESGFCRAADINKYPLTSYSISVALK